VLVVLGAILMVTAMVIRFDIGVSDSPLYLSGGTPGATAGATGGLAPVPPESVEVVK
jgi:hypothetical protein